jgi:hypothetical protein
MGLEFLVADLNFGLIIKGVQTQGHAPTKKIPFVEMKRYSFAIIRRFPIEPGMTRVILAER